MTEECDWCDQLPVATIEEKTYTLRLCETCKNIHEENVKHHNDLKAKYVQEYTRLSNEELLSLYTTRANEHGDDFSTKSYTEEEEEIRGIVYEIMHEEILRRMNFFQPVKCSSICGGCEH